MSKGSICGKKKRLSRLLIITMILILCLTQSAGITAFGADGSDIAAQEDAVNKAKQDLDAANKQYAAEKKAAEEKIKVSESELSNVGREFIDYMVSQAYASDKSISGAKPLDQLTVQGCINKAYANKDCKAVIDKMNKAASSQDYTYEGMVSRALTVDNIKKAIGFMEKCNSIRKSLGLYEYRVSPYLMAGSAAASPIEYYSKTHTYVSSGCFVNVIGKKVYDSIAWGKSDPFPGWYDAEKAKADKGETTGISHYKAIVSTNYKQTGACWIDNVSMAEQSFIANNSGTTYTTAEFRNLLDSFIENKKAQIVKDKEASMDLFKNKPDYVKNAEAALANAKKALTNTIKSYKPVIETSNYSYDKIKVSYSIPKGFDGIKILRSDTGKAKSYSVKNTSTSGRSYVNTGLTTGKTFYYKAYLYKMVDGKKIMSQYSDGVKEKVRPAKVSGLSARKTQSGKLKITWKTIRGASGYDVYVRRTGESKSARLVKGKSVRGVKLTSLNSKKAVAYAASNEHGEYLVKVRAYRMVNGKKVPGFCSKEFSVVL